ncbi:MAG TPA: M20 aminoacylase family protein [Burkholderiaceae bacterium]|nr:M20 aminoacylase family protein [Burkholderiaceae bacterium]
MMLAEGILELQSEIQAIRRDLHAHPELRYEEHRTAAVVAAKLRAWGLEVTEGIGGTGVVGTLRRGASTRSVGLRADMDALPLQEHNAFAHASKHAGKMHACGHDGHTAMLLAGARWLSLHGGFDGVVHFIFQPAEEGGAGAQKMIDEGLFERFPCEAVFGMHNWPGTAVGTFSVTPGPMMASSNEFEITIRGKGAHAALPHNGIDPVLVATHLVQALQSIITRNKKPVEAAVLSVTEIHAGDATNIIPDSAIVRGTVRTFTIETLDLIESRMKALTEQLPPAFGATGSLHFHRNYPPTINEPAQTAFAVGVMTELVGADNVNAACEPTMGSEDFAFMLLAKPGCYAFIGNGDGSHREGGHGMGPCMLHNPSYDFNDELIPLGGSYWVKLVQRFLPVAA